MIDLYKKIISKDNIVEAYKNIVQKFDKSGKSNKYSGYDGLNLNNYDYETNDILKKIQLELTELSNFEDAIKVSIPKKSKVGYRDVYLHNVKERIKAHAVYQIVEPFIDKILSPYLFSYRASHPHHLVIRGILRRLKKNKEEFILTGDISRYSDNIDQGILIEKIKNLNFDNKTSSLIIKCIYIKYIDKGIISKMEKGIVTGLPITVLFNNLYLNDLDKKIGKKISFYRRVGDDFIAFGSYKELLEIKKDIEDSLEYLKINKTEQKLKIIRNSDDFVFLGYRFRDNQVCIPDFSLNKIKSRIRKKLKFYPVSIKQKIKILKKILHGKNSLFIEIIEILKQYNYVNDERQIKKLSNYFFIRLTIFFFNSYSSRNHRKTIDVTRNIKLPSIFNFYISVHRGEKTFSDLRREHDIIRKNEGF